MTYNKLEIDMLNMAAAMHDQAIEACYGNGCDADDEPRVCGACAGSGEGMYDGSTCSTCKGAGEMVDLEAQRDREAERADYEYDQMKDDQMLAGAEDCFPDDDLPY